jgi:molybdate transport system substrate-binding protein
MKRTINSAWALLLIFAGLLPFAEAQTKPELHVAAAADMQPVFTVIGPYFERKTGIHLVVSYGASATLAQQIVAGSPADIFFSADYVFAERIVSAGLADSRNAVPYAKGTLVLWARKDSPAQPLHLEVLERKDLKSIAIANPEHAPYGRAAVAALKKMKYYDNVAPHLVQAESVAQAAQFGESGNAQLALISQTIAMSPKFQESGTYVLFPKYVYPEIRQCAVILKKSPSRDNAHKLLDYILSAEIQDNLRKLGLDPIK